MFPLRDSIRSRTFPVVTFTLIVANAVVFLWELTLGRRLDEALIKLSIIPVRYTVREVAALYTPAEQILPFFTSMFLHGGWIHIIGNMWVLWIFGDNIEERLGRLRYLALYFLGGFVAALMHIFTNPTSGVPTIGASGAVAAIMGAYFRFYPFARVEAVIPPFFFGPTVVLPAVLFLGLWFVLQFYSGALSLIAPTGFGGVAWWAHVGGFLFGAVIAGVAQTRPRRLH
ncbi:MAG: rhomboid family intramembrane serine protease [Verrucomicrobiae bacterium]|nr:rhomboid family intramembrane serine protease [Verrucomicrobiae bacterium]MDW7980250.1 rhomboid family intramembrane serine protease [Verrucomicrobiales bacterium]